MGGRGWRKSHSTGLDNVLKRLECLQKDRESRLKELKMEKGSIIKKDTGLKKKRESRQTQSGRKEKP